MSNEVIGLCVLGGIFFIVVLDMILNFLSGKQDPHPHDEECGQCDWGCDSDGECL